MRIRDLNWMQLEEYLQSDDRIVLPGGSTQQHAYLSLETDNILAERGLGRGRRSARCAGSAGRCLRRDGIHGVPGSPTVSESTLRERTQREQRRRRGGRTATHAGRGVARAVGRPARRDRCRDRSRVRPRIVVGELPLDWLSATARSVAYTRGPRTTRTRSGRLRSRRSERASKTGLPRCAASGTRWVRLSGAGVASRR
jgi:hypothetical protein